MMRAVVLALAGILAMGLITASCNETGSPPASGGSTKHEAEGSTTMKPNGAVEFVSVGRGNLAWNPREEGFGPQVVVFRSRAAWEKLGGHYQFGETAPDWQGKLAGVNFARQSIVALTLGERGSTGYSIELKRIEPGPPMRFEMAGTKPNGPAGMMMTHPFHLVIVNATKLPEVAEFLLDGAKTDFERHVME